MKKIILFLGMATALILVLDSCKKGGGMEDDDDDDNECEISVASIAGKYKLIASKDITNTTERDVLHENYEACELDDINELKADKTFVYSDAGTVCSPSGSTSGTWDVTGRTLRLNSGFSNIESFNCTDLVVTFRDGSSNLIKETYRKQ